MENNDVSENIKKTESEKTSLMTNDDESFKLGNRAVMLDFYVSSDIENREFKKNFIRLNAKKEKNTKDKLIFRNVNFNHCFF